MRCTRICFGVVLGWLLLLGTVGADEPQDVSLLRPDCLEGWQYGDLSPAGWTIADGRLTGTAASTPLLSGWTFGDFDLSFQWSVEAGEWKIRLPDVPVGEGIEIALGDGEHHLQIRDGTRPLADGITVAPLPGKRHQALLVRKGDKLSLTIDTHTPLVTIIPNGSRKLAHGGTKPLYEVVPACQRRFGLGLAVAGGRASLQELRVREPRGESMFNGKDLAGWWCPRDIRAWGAQDGKIVWLHSGGDYLRSEREYGNFTFSCQYKTAKGTNSGVGIRTPRLGWPSGDGMEMQIWDVPLARSLDKHQAMAIYGNVPPLARADRSEQWNDVVIKADGYMISAWVNGVLVQHYNTFRHPELKWRHLKGWIGFQDHGGKIEFRDIRVLSSPDGLGLDVWCQPQPLSLQAQVVDRLMNNQRLAMADGFVSGAVSVNLGQPQRDEAPLPPKPGPKKKASSKKNDTKTKATPAPIVAATTIPPSQAATTAIGKPGPAAAKIESQSKEPAPAANKVQAKPKKPELPKADFVLAELQGPGAIVRIARTSSEGTLIFYLDGESKPRLESKPAELSQVAPELADDANPTLTFIPYRQSVKVMLRKASGAEYRIDYLTFPANSPVETYRKAEAGFPRAWLAALGYRWSQHGGGTVRQCDPLPRPACVPRAIAPGASVPLVHVDGTGIVHWVQLQASKKVLGSNDLWLDTTVDGEKQPAISAPARLWYAASGNYHNFLFTERNGMLIRLAMPFARGITFTARNCGTKTIADVGLNTSVEPATKENCSQIAGLMRLRAKYLPASNDSPTLFELGGAGRWIGLVYQQPAGKPTGIAALVIDGQSSSGWATPDLDAFLGYMWPDTRCATAGRKGPLSWRYMLLESVDFARGIQLTSTDPHLGDRLVWYYAR